MRIFCLICFACIVFCEGCEMSTEEARVKGFELYNVGNYEDAPPLLEKVIAVNDQDPELIVRLAYCRVVINDDPSSAIEILTNSVIRFPDYARTFYELSQIAYEYGPAQKDINLDQALEFSGKAAELAPNDFSILENHANFNMLRGNLDSAYVWYKKANEIVPDQYEVRMRMIQIESLIKQRALLDSLGGIDTIVFRP